MNIYINVTNKRPVVDGAPIIVCGNSDYTIQFAFDGEWAAHLAKTARFVFQKDGRLQYIDVPFVGSLVKVPVLSGIREVYVGVYAGDLCTTTPTKISCEKSILCGTGSEHEEPDPDVYAQIIDLINDLGAALLQEGDVVLYENPAATLDEDGVFMEVIDRNFLTAGKTYTVTINCPPCGGEKTTTCVCTVEQDGGVTSYWLDFNHYDTKIRIYEQNGAAVLHVDSPMGYAAETISLTIIGPGYGKINSQILPGETWIFELEDGSTISKQVVVK